MINTTTNIEAFCSLPFKRLKFTPEGFVTMCCFQQRRCLGNILKTSLEKIWFSPLAEEVRQETLKGTLHRTCRWHSCPFIRTKDRPLLTFEQKEFPQEFEIDLPTQHCNIGGENPTDDNPACIMCERHNKSPEQFRQEDHLEEICKHLKPYMHHINILHIQGIAEPFWKDRIFQILEWLDVERYKDKIIVSTTTNGTLMSERHRKMFLAFPNSCITWSIDAGSPEVYQQIRRVNMYERIKENLLAYCQERKPGQSVNIHNNINTINIGDVEKMVEMAALVGVDRLDFNATYGVPSICVNKRNCQQFVEAQKKIMVLATKLGVNVTFMRDLALNLAPAPEWQNLDSFFEIEPELHQIQIPLA